MSSPKWKDFYQTLWQFVATMVINFIILAAISYMTFKSFRRFWFYGKANATTKRASQSKRGKDQDIKTSLRLLTSLYLICVLVFLLGSFLFRILIAVFGIPIACFASDSVFIWAILARIILSLIYLTRLHTSFGDSVYAYSKYLLIILGIIDIIGISGTAIWYMYNVAISAHSSISSTDCVTRFNYSFYIMPLVLFDSIFNIIIVSLFIHRLVILVREMSQLDTDFRATIKKQLSHYDYNYNYAVEDDNNINGDDKDGTHDSNGINGIDSKPMALRLVMENSANSSSQQQQLQAPPKQLKLGDNSPKHSPVNSNHSMDAYGRNLSLKNGTYSHMIVQETSASVRKNGKLERLIGLIAKLTILLFISIISTMLLLVTIGLWLPGAASFIDVWINAVCALYCFKTYDKYYAKHCSICHSAMFDCCICCMFTIPNAKLETTLNTQAESTVTG